jgi:hypothetical protein
MRNVHVWKHFSFWELKENCTLWHTNAYPHSCVHTCTHQGMMSSLHPKVFWLYFKVLISYTVIFKFFLQVCCSFFSHYWEQMFISYTYYLIAENFSVWFVDSWYIRDLEVKTIFIIILKHYFPCYWIEMFTSGAKAMVDKTPDTLPCTNNVT